ncbi:MAG TPA: hypothetical protein VHE81_04425, partial [Lacipirellulaceae bacterium]|nr:hypothetical protein [Lacipirellulaceae bacterium]
MRSLLLSLIVACLAVSSTTIAADSSQPIHVTIDAAKTGAPINPFIYGQFIEHLGRCIYGGIWAEMLEDRKFYFPITDKYDPYRGLNDTKFPVIAASPWEVLGPAGSVTMVKKNAFAGEQSAEIAAGSGIRQNDLGLVAGKKYVGYVWARAPHAASFLTIHFNWRSSESLTTVPLPEAARNDYQKVPFKFTAKDNTDKGSLSIEASAAPLVIGAISLMPADNVHGFRADTLALLKQLHGTIYRWPGGNFVSGYDWRDGIGPRDRRPTRKNPAWSGIDSNDVGLDEFLDLCHQIDAEPLIAVNTGFGDDYSAAQEVEYTNGSKVTIGGSWRVKYGHAEPYAVKYWCVGNEMWGPWQLGHMEFNQYALKHERFVRAMRKVDPDILLVGSGDLGTKVTLNDGKEKHEMSWSEGLLRRCGDAMDFISEHFYEGRTPWGGKTPDDLPVYVALLKNEIHKKARKH